MVIKDGVLLGVAYTDLMVNGKLIVPDGVTKIKLTWANRCYGIRSVVIPDSVKVIGSWSFSGCHTLTEVDLGHGVEVIEDSAFYSCTGLSSIILPDSLTYIGELALRNTGLTSVVIPDSVTHIGSGAFGSNDYMTSVVVGKNVTRIPPAMFEFSPRLTSVTFKGDVTSIGQEAFYDCGKLSEINFPDSLTSIGMTAFIGTRLKSERKNYKAFRITPKGNLICRKKRYTVGKKASVKGELTVCENGIHYCTNLFEIFNFYYGKYGKDFVICECEVSDEKKEGLHSSKKCARWIIPQRILPREEVVKILNDGIKKN